MYMHIYRHKGTCMPIHATIQTYMCRHICIQMYVILNWIIKILNPVTVKIVFLSIHTINVIKYVEPEFAVWISLGFSCLFHW